MAFSLILTAIILGVTAVRAAEIQTFHFPTPPGLTRSDVNIVDTGRDLKAVMVLCPGQNEDGKEGIERVEWQAFAQQNHLGLVSIGFSSPDASLTYATRESSRGYFYASKGSGQILVQAIRQFYGKDLPLLIYGFSGGAMFTASFVEWAPQRVLTWCAYSGGWWDPLNQKPSAIPGLLACGENDERLGATLTYFLQGRALGRRWTWITLEKTDHAVSRTLEDFVRIDFATILAQKGAETGQWRDIDSKIELSAAAAAATPSLAVWLPDRSTASQWASIHHP